MKRIFQFLRPMCLPTHVLGFEIPVHDVSLVQVLDSVDQGIHDFARFDFREPVAFF